MESGVEVWLRLATTGAWVPAAVQSKKSQAEGKIRIEVLEIGKPKLANGDDDCVSFVVDDELTDMNDLKLKNSETEGYVENLINSTSEFENILLIPILPVVKNIETGKIGVEYTYKLIL